MKSLRFILFPISIVYGLVTAIRNFLFNKKVLKEYAFDVPVINVGNLTVGGTGKTPFVEYLIRTYKESHKMAVLSRGYGRKSKGFLVADTTSDATKIGDEPMQYFTKFGKEVLVTVGEDRVQSIPGIFAHKEDTSLIVLDDAYQHRYIKPSFNILLTKYQKLFYKDFILPSGNLRESRKGASRADAIVVTKCPKNLGETEKQQMSNMIQHYAGKKSVYFTTINYGVPVPVFATTDPLNGNVFLFSGIANDQELVEYVDQAYGITHVVSYYDHYHYTKENIAKLIEKYRANGKGGVMLTTEKDMVKLQPFAALFEGIQLFYLPIEISFMAEEQHFLEQLNEVVH